MVQVKICGITTWDDAIGAVEAGADMLGFNFYNKSRRYIDPRAAQTISDNLRDTLGPDCPLLVGIFVNDAVGNVSLVTNQVGLDAAQLSGDESTSMLAELSAYTFKAVHPQTVHQALDDARYFSPYFPKAERLPSLLLDAYHPGEYGGTGKQAEDDIALAVKDEVPRLMLAGGLTPENVGARVRAVQPWGVDVASGVEGDDAPLKDVDKMRAFVQSVRDAEV